MNIEHEVPHLVHGRPLKYASYFESDQVEKPLPAATANCQLNQVHFLARILVVKSTPVPRGKINSNPAFDTLAV